VVTHQLQVERRTAKAHRPKTDALPLDHATNPYSIDFASCSFCGDVTWRTASRGSEVNSAVRWPLQEVSHEPNTVLWALHTMQPS